MTHLSVTMAIVKICLELLIVHVIPDGKENTVKQTNWIHVHQLHVETMVHVLAFWVFTSVFASKATMVMTVPLKPQKHVQISPARTAGAV